MFRACITLVASLDSGKIWFEKSSQSMVWWNDCFGWQISTDGIGQFFAHWDLPGCLLWRNLDMVSWSPNMSDDSLRCIFDHISHDQGDCVAWKHAAFVSAAVSWTENKNLKTASALSLDEQFYVEQRSVDVLATYRDVSPAGHLVTWAAIEQSC